MQHRYFAGFVCVNYIWGIYLW